MGAVGPWIAAHNPPNVKSPLVAWQPTVGDAPDTLAIAVIVAGSTVTNEIAALRATILPYRTRGTDYALETKPSTKAHRIVSSFLQSPPIQCVGAEVRSLAR